MANKSTCIQLLKRASPVLWGSKGGFVLLLLLFASFSGFAQCTDCAYYGGVSAVAFHFVGERNDVNCNPAYTNTSTGGNADGSSMDIKNYIACDPNIVYYGGYGGTQNISTASFADCTPAYLNTSTGGNADGTTMDIKNYIACDPNIVYYGGYGGMQNEATGNFTDCTPPVTGVSIGGNADGHALDLVNYTSCGLISAYFGGTGGFQSITTGSFLNCTPAYTQVTVGGDADGHSIDNLAVCTPVVPVCTVVPDAGSDASVCTGQSTQLQASGGSTYSWSPAAGLSDPNISNPVATPAATTTYTVTVSDVVCSLIDSVTITVNPYPSPAIAGTTTICNGQSTTLDATTAGAISYSWNTGPTSPSITVGPSSNTTYSVTVTNMYNCATTVNATVTVNPTPVAGISGTLVICNGNSTTLTASGGGTYLWAPGGETTTAITVSPASTTTYSVTATNAFGCSNTTSATVTVTPNPTASISGTTTICVGNSTTLTASGGSTYLWAPGGETTAAITVSPATTSSYTVTATIGTCFSSTSTTVTVIPAAAISGTTTICSGGSTTLTASGGGASPSYSWNTGATTQAITVSPTNPPSSSYPYSVTVTDAFCSTVANTTVTVNPIPAADAGSSQSICYSASTSIGAAAVGGNTYSWAPTAGLSDPSAANPTANPTATTTYTVTETVTATGCQNSNSVTVTVYPQVAVSGGTSTCTGTSNTLLASGGSGISPTYLWSTTETTQFITVSPASTTTYTVTLTDAICTGSATATITIISPCVLQNVATGGNSDGHAHDMVNYLTCADVSYLGGTAGYQVSSLGSFANCTPAYLNVSTGSNSDGHSYNLVNYLNCNPSISYLGGTAGYQIAALGNFLNCTPAYANVTKGGNSDGHSLNVINYLFCNQNMSYLGGTAGYQIAIAGTFQNCTPPYLNVSLGGNSDGHSLDTPGPCLVVALPIELLSFTATLLPNKQVECDWATSSEINNDYFTLEKTKDGINYSVVGTVKGAGNSTGILSYSMTDKEPFKGTSYYRLKQTDYDGNFRYSQLEPITILSSGMIINTYPNPVTEELIVHTFTKEEFTATIEISDLLGRRVFYKSQLFEKNSTTGDKIFINTSSFREGMYLLSIRNSATNKPLYIQRIVKLGG